LSEAEAKMAQTTKSAPFLGAELTQSKLGARKRTNASEIGG
jgi:hypothetical protein